jgi:acyl-CoA reductase-like NAD-dependent aldehyde dehydrogenase
VKVYDRLYIDGAWVVADGAGVIDVFDSTSGLVMASVPAGSAADVDRAARAARKAADDWAELAIDERAQLLTRIADGLEARSGELLDLIVRETGMAVGSAKGAQVGHAIGSFRAAAAIAETYEYEELVGATRVVREPLGVVGCITPWNYPLRQLAAKVAYALAAGNTVVMKPSEITPVDAFVFAEVVHEVGLPQGVFNLVSGLGPEAGEAIATHADIDMVAFTGSTRVGKRVAEVASATVKRVALELGGKGPTLVLDDLDPATFAKAVTFAVGRCFPNSGQTCAALTRLLVPRSRLAEAEVVAAAAAAEFTVGDPFAEGTKLGPLASAPHRDKVEGYIRVGIDEGATLLVGGPGAPDGLETGYYVRPTVFSNVHSDMRISKEEIFGPVLVIVPYDTDAEGVAIANDTPYGLSAGVWGADPARAELVARRIKAGTVDVNGARSDALAPFGGYKQSGYGREYGRHGFEEFLQTKALNITELGN